MARYSKRTTGKAKSEPLAAPSTWGQLLDAAMTNPGVISKAYSNFHSYSFGNMMLAMVQCMHRGIEMGPMATYNAWQRMGRQVQKGEDSLILCQPLSFKTGEQDDAGNDQIITRFMYRKGWFVLAQTEGDDVAMEPVAGWDYYRALTALDISEETFNDTNGNKQGYSVFSERSLAINPVAAMPLKTAAHEIAHLLMHNPKLAADQHEMCEVEAEAVAMLVVAALDLPGVDEARGYIQNWADKSGVDRSQILTDDRIKAIFKTTDTILKAGRMPLPEEVENDAADVA